MDTKPSVVSQIMHVGFWTKVRFRAIWWKSSTFDRMCYKSSEQLCSEKKEEVGLKSIWSDSKPCEQMLTSEDCKKAKWLKKRDLTLD